MFSTKAFNINVIHSAVEEYTTKHGAMGLSVLPTHFDPGTFEAMGIAQSERDGVVIEVGRIAQRRENERQARHQANADMRAKLDAGLITEEEYADSFMWA